MPSGRHGDDSEHTGNVLGGRGGGGRTGRDQMVPAVHLQSA